jgi:hypothetical protein
MRHKAKLVFHGLFGLLLLLSSPEVSSANPNESKRFSVELEGGGVWQSKNDVRIPGDNGTEYSFRELTGGGPDAYARLTFDWRIRQRHGLRLVAAPLRAEGSGTFDQTVFFAGATFAPAVSTQGKYKFDTYRLTYRYLFYEKNAWHLHVGGTLLVRDAKIELAQNSLTASDSNVGAVPLLHFSAQRRLDERWTANLEFDGLAGGPGRALDLALKMGYDLTDRWRMGAGYRVLEGGVDNDEVYNFSWFNFAFLTVGYLF